MLVHQSKDNRLDDFNREPGHAAYMMGKDLDWPTILVEIDNSLVQSAIKVPDCRFFIPNNSNNATSDIVV
jgi:hypothetical protein